LKSLSACRPEHVVEGEILDWLALSGVGFFWKNTSGGFFDGKRMRKHTSSYAIRGTSDILGLTNGGRLIALEVKNELGSPSKEQIVFIKKVQQCGGLAGLVRSVDQTRELFLEWGLIDAE